jgi:hypothetical protein
MFYACKGADVDAENARKLVRVAIAGVTASTPVLGICWQANIGRLAALTGADDAGVLLREAAGSSDALYGPDHPWTLSRAAAGAIADDDPDALRAVVTTPVWR